MIFASDLDRTLIYSKKAFGCLEDNLQVRLIETLDGQEISFMTEKAISKLKELIKRILFIPVTTRTIEQYRRITLFQKEIMPKYAVVSNGANILVDGEPDPKWRSLVRDKIGRCLSIEEVKKVFCKIMNDNWVRVFKTADEVFCYAVIDREQMPMQEIKQFSDWLNKNNWVLSIQGRKLYLVPEPINKWSALVHIKNLTSHEVVAAAGDSLLDLPMLDNADYALRPAHGELDNHCSNSIKRTRTSGIKSSEEILDYVSEIKLG